MNNVKKFMEVLSTKFFGQAIRLPSLPFTSKKSEPIQTLNEEGEIFS